MKISSQQLRQIIKEEASRVPGSSSISPEQAEAYLRSKADSYRRQGVTGKSMEMLLMDDFMDDLGHQHDPEDYEGYIRELVLGESNMKLTKNRLRRLIKEELATVTDDSIEDVVMGVLSDEGGAAGVDPIEDALENLEDDAISLPDEDIEDIIDNVPGVKRHADGDYIDTTQLEGKTMRITKRQLRQIIKEEKAKVLAENRVRKAVREALLKEAAPGGDPEEFGGTAGYDWVKTGEVEVGDYVEVITHNDQVVRGTALSHGDATRGGPIVVSQEKTWDGRVKQVNGQIHMKTEPDAKGRGGGTNEFVDFPVPRNSRMVLKRAKPGYQQQSLDL